MKTNTKGLLIMVAVLAALAVGCVIFVLLSKSTEVTYDQFWNKLYNEHAYSSVKKVNDTWTAETAGGKKETCTVIMHDIVYEDTNAIKNYNAGIKLVTGEEFKALDAEGKTARWEEYKSETFANFQIVISGDYKSWSEIGSGDWDGTVEIRMNNRYQTSIWDYVYPVAMVLMVIIFAVFMFRTLRGNGNVSNNFGKSKSNVSTSLKVRFTDVAGAEEEKEELAEIVEFLKNPTKFTNLGARIPKGVLLVGPPGTGKTLFAKAVAGEANVPFFSISGSDFVEMYVGVGASRVRDLFDQAKKNQPCIVFIDEIDAVGRQRGAGMGGGNDEREQTLNQLLVQMDGFETNESVIIMAATNRPDILDPALLRPGRFDRQVYVNYPDVRGREAIFKVHSRNKPLSAEIDFQVLARMTSGFTGADIASLLNEAAILCARAGRKHIIMEDIYEGINKITMGPQKKSRLVTEVDKRITAYHEGGHAIVAKKLAPYSVPVQEVSIIPRGQAAGYTLMRPDNDDDRDMLKNFKASLAVAMGGRAAEELVIKDIGAGSRGDIRQATDLAMHMITEWGMSDLGPVYYGGGQEVFLGRDYGTSHSYSEATAAKIDEQLHKFINEAHDTATKILSESRETLDLLVRVLYEKETIYSDEFDMVMKGETFDNIIKYIDGRIERKLAKTDKA